MKIFIIRHAQAVTGNGDDPSRALDEQGQQQAKQLAHWLSEQSHGEFKLLSSPYLRAKQTASEIAGALNSEIEEHATLTPNSSTEEALNTIYQYDQDLILVSHQPLVGRLSSQLVDGDNTDQPWSTAECRVLEGDVAHSACMQMKTLWYPA